MAVSDKTVGRLSLYRRLLTEMALEGVRHIYSHQLANFAGVTAAQVRRDIMSLGYSGSPTRGYAVAELTESIGHFIDDPRGQGVALVGVGNLGRAILAYLAGRRPNLAIVAAFDRDCDKAGRVIHGCRCYLMEELAAVVEQKSIRTGIIAVPAGEAQAVADQLVRSGIRGILNFAPAPLRTAEHVYVEDMDITMSMEKVAFFARRGAFEKDLAT